MLYVQITHLNRIDAIYFSLFFLSYCLDIDQGCLVLYPEYMLTLLANLLSINLTSYLEILLKYTNLNYYLSTFLINDFTNIYSIIVEKYFKHNNASQIWIRKGETALVKKDKSNDPTFIGIS
jgi:hypothetical protein